MDTPFKYITVLDYLNGQVYVYDYDATTMPNAEDFVRLVRGHEESHSYYMVHKHPPALWTANLYYCSREEAHHLSHDEDGNEVYTEHLPPR